MADGMLRNMQSPINSKYHKLQVQLVFQQGVLFCSLYFRLALHVSANAIFRSTTVSWQPLVCGWFSVFVIPCGRYLSRALTLSHCQTQTVRKCECPRQVPATWNNKNRKPSTHQWLPGYSCAPEDGVSRNM